MIYKKIEIIWLIPQNIVQFVANTTDACNGIMTNTYLTLSILLSAYMLHYEEFIL